MIRAHFYDAVVKRERNGKRRWFVVLRGSDVALATCDTANEGFRVRDYLNDMPRVLRELGEKVS